MRTRRLLYTTLMYLSGSVRTSRRLSVIAWKPLKDRVPPPPPPPWLSTLAGGRTACCKTATNERTNDSIDLFAPTRRGPGSAPHDAHTRRDRAGREREPTEAGGRAGGRVSAGVQHGAAAARIDSADGAFVALRGAGGGGRSDRPTDAWGTQSVGARGVRARRHAR